MDALREMERANPRLRFIPTFTRITKNYRGWKGETGHISQEMLSTHISNLRGAIYYVAGPPMMVEAARRTLNEVGEMKMISGTEEFAGY